MNNIMKHNCRGASGSPGKGHLINMKKQFLRLISVTMILFAGIAAGALEPHGEKPNRLKVGFFEFNGYHMKDAEGVRSGYGYDLLQLIRPYMHCKYEYVGYEKGWSEMLPMLERGEIDFVTSAVKTPEKLKKFDFSDISIGNSSVIMTVKTGHTKYLPKDYANWNGIRIGMIPGNSKNDVFHNFSQKKGFHYETCFYKHAGELSEALQSGRVDAIVSGSLRKTSNEVIYEQLDIQPFYIIVKKGNKKLLAKINTALEALSLETPGFAGELQQIYYGHWRNNLKQVPFTAIELAFIRESNKANRHFVVLLQPGQFPLEYLKDGKPRGVFVDVVEMLSRSSGLKFKFLVAKDMAEYFQLRSERQCDLIMDIPHDFRWAEQSGYVQTKPYYPVGTSMLTRKHSLRKDIRTVGTLQGSFIHRIALKNKPDGVTIHAYPSNDATIEAVISGEIDGAYLLGPMVDNAILNDHIGRFAQERSARVVDFSIGIRDDVDARFTSIISKCVNSFSRQELLKISRDNNLRRDKATSFRDLIAENPLTFSLSVFTVIAMLGGALIVVLIFHRRSIKSSALLAKNSRMWKSLLDTLPVHVFAKDANTLRSFFCNRARGDFFGKEPEQLENVATRDYMPENLAKQQDAATRELVSHPDQIREQLFSIANAKGEMREMHIIQKVFQEKDGTNIVLGCAIDQTDLETARRTAQENAEWFQKTLISIGDGVLSTDIDGRIELLNPVAEKMLGTTLAECKGKTHTDYFNIVSYLDDAPVPSPVARCLNAGEIVTLANHTDLISRNGTRYHIADSAAPIRGKDGKIAGAILVFRDVTEEYNLRDRLQTTANQLRDALAQAQQASSAKGIFLSQMSHEIRTPLNAIIGYLNIAQEYDSDQLKVKECLRKGLDASEHLLSIINDILDISSIENGKLKIAHEDFDFKHLLTGIVSMVYHQAEQKGIKFEMHLRDLTEEWLVGDSLRVNQILLNLLSNALKFTPAGGSVTLQVKQLAIVHNHVQLMMQVSDTGCGMNEEYKSRLFTPFEQQDASTARKFGGTGLGLSITKNLVSLMGGTITVDSKEGVGTTFTTHLPFERSRKTLAVADADFSKLRALIVDDREEDRAYIQMVLAKCGVKSDAVDSGENAIRQLERRLDSRHPYDLCLLDLRLVGMDGIETTRRIRKLQGITPNMPIVLVTAYDAVSISADAHAAGVNKIIQKPLFQSTFFDFLMSSYYNINEKKNTQDIQEGLSGQSIMLVEDNQMNMDISTQYLERAGMKITPAWNGREAVEIFVKSAPGTYQAILMDIQMPVMDGYQATEAIRSSNHPEAKTIPIIAMTANAFNEDIVKALSVGMNDHIAKPIFYDRLFSSLSNLTRKKGSDEK